MGDSGFRPLWILIPECRDVFAPSLGEGTYSPDPSSSDYLWFRNDGTSTGQPHLPSDDYRGSVRVESAKQKSEDWPTGQPDLVFSGCFQLGNLQEPWKDPRYVGLEAARRCLRSILLLQFKECRRKKIISDGFVGIPSGSCKAGVLNTANLTIGDSLLATGRFGTSNNNTVRRYDDASVLNGQSDNRGSKGRLPKQRMSEEQELRYFRNNYKGTIEYEFDPSTAEAVGPTASVDIDLSPDEKSWFHAVGPEPCQRKLRGLIFS
jgi:hypothetical protein